LLNRREKNSAVFSMAISYQQEKIIKKKRRIISRTKHFFVLAAVLAAAAVVVLFFGDLFDVRTVNINASLALSSDAVHAKAWEVLDEKVFGISRKNNIMIFSPQKIESVLKDTFPRIDSVKIRRISPHELSIDIIERSPVGLWCLMAKSRCFYYDDTGIAFAEIAPSSGYIFIAVHDYTEREIQLGEQVASVGLRTNILELKKILQFGGITVASVEITPDALDEFKIVTTEGWSILYINDDTVREQTNNLLAFLKNNISSRVRSNLNYIDLRIDDRIYYKTKE